MIIENVFPTPIGFFNFDEGLSENEKSFLVNLKQRPIEGNTSSVDKYILKQREVSNLTTFIEKSLHKYLMATVCPKNDVRLRITQSWLNWTKPGQYHHKHTHSNSFISGCFYVSANKNSDRIYFYKDKYQPINFPPVEWNTYNSESWWYAVGSNDLVLFPSSLLHMVQPVGGEDTRISLAFNTFPVGYVGDEEELTALHLEK